MNDTKVPTHASFYEYMEQIGIWNGYRAFCVCSGFACLLCNGLLLVLFARNSKLVNVAYFSYVVSDFLSGIRPFAASFLMYGNDVDWVCELVKIMASVTGLGFVFNVLLLATDRLIAGVAPHAYKTIMKKTRTAVIVSAIWLLVTTVSVITSLLRKENYGCGHKFNDNPWVELGRFIIACVSILIALIFYAILFTVLTYRNNNTESWKAVISAVRTAFLVTLINAVGWSPQQTCFIIYFCHGVEICGYLDKDVTVVVVFLAIPMLALTSAANACIAVYRNHEIRADLVLLLKCIRKNRVAPEGRRLAWRENLITQQRTENAELRQLDTCQNRQIVSPNRLTNNTTSAARKIVIEESSTGTNL